MSKSSSKSAKEKESATYQTMLSELDDIVRTVGQGQLDLDEIVGKIEHGYKLISTMRERLDVTKSKVEKLRVDFDHAIQLESSNSKDHSERASSVHEKESDDDDAPF